MFIKKLSTLLLILLLTTINITAEENSVEPVFSDIEITGFMDFISSYHNTIADETNISLGQAEIDLTKDIGSNKSIELAIAYNNDESKFELGAAILDIHLSNSVGERHNRKSSYIHSSLIVGQFDVPFGIDYQSYASVDRKLISAPRVVDLTHEGWNDVGLNLTMENSYGNLSVFVVNGFESSAEITSQVINIATGLPEDQIDEVDTTPSNAFGGRLGMNLFSGLEVGSSLALGLNADNKDEMMIIGADVQYNMSNLLIKGEYIQHSVNRSVQEENHKGYYLQSLYNFDSFFLTSRYGSFKPDGVEWVGQLSIGGGIPISDGVEIRVESLIHESSANNITMLQFVSEF